ncbi:hypothetical protein BC827DRAFT_1154286 [Russula dissimulans]|nr:hypothetical protein BC827DRAFT_1154286 [Russula dissimulans]
MFACDGGHTGQRGQSIMFFVASQRRAARTRAATDHDPFRVLLFNACACVDSADIFGSEHVVWTLASETNPDRPIQPGNSSEGSNGDNGRYHGTIRFDQLLAWENQQSANWIQYWGTIDFHVERKVANEVSWAVVMEIYERSKGWYRWNENKRGLRATGLVQDTLGRYTRRCRKRARVIRVVSFKTMGLGYDNRWEDARAKHFTVDLGPPKKKQRRASGVNAVKYWASGIVGTVETSTSHIVKDEHVDD